MRLLFVENDVHYRRILCEFLRREGFQVIQHSDGAAALDFLSDASVRPDVILTDRDMPHMNGIELVRTLRIHGDHTPIVMLSGHAEPAVIAQAHAAGVDRYLVKPVVPQLLAMTLRELALGSAVLAADSLASRPLVR